MPFGLGFGELVIILLIVTVVFGVIKFFQLGDGLGKAIRNFKRSVEPGQLGEGGEAEEDAAKGKGGKATKSA